jgi:exosome complex RNA-binding protein Rrp4
MKHSFQVGDRVHWLVQSGETEPRWFKTSVDREYGPIIHGIIQKINRTRVRIVSDRKVTWIVPLDALTKA